MWNEVIHNIDRCIWTNINAYDKNMRWQQIWARDKLRQNLHHHCLLNRLFGQIKENLKAPRASPAFVRGIHRSPVNSPHKLPITRKMFPFDDVIICKVPVTSIAAMYIFRYLINIALCFRCLDSYYGNRPIEKDYPAREMLCWSPCNSFVSNQVEQSMVIWEI